MDFPERDGKNPIDKILPLSVCFVRYPEHMTPPPPHGSESPAHQRQQGLACSIDGVQAHASTSLPRLNIQHPCVKWGFIAMHSPRGEEVLERSRRVRGGGSCRWGAGRVDVPLAAELWTSIFKWEIKWILKFGGGCSNLKPPCHGKWRLCWLVTAYWAINPPSLIRILRASYGCYWRHHWTSIY